jgi:UDP-3-O-[3-hydroxymyristoyl] N-acetylglucosamine deacetylase
VEARPENVSDTARCTRLGGISTIEHLMSALGAYGITDAEIELTTPEMPAMDGSAKPYFDALSEVQIVPIEAVEYEGLFARIYDKHPGAEIAIGSGEGHWRYDFIVENRFPGSQVFEHFFTGARYGEEVAPARTMAFDFEVEPARAAGLGLGLDENSCLVLGPEGYVNAARFPDEAARHKLLDLMGDLWLARVSFGLLNVVGVKSGHTANVSAAHKLSQAVRRVAR